MTRSQLQILLTKRSQLQILLTKRSQLQILLTNRSRLQILLRALQKVKVTQKRKLTQTERKQLQTLYLNLIPKQKLTTLKSYRVLNSENIVISEIIYILIPKRNIFFYPK